MKALLCREFGPPGCLTVEEVAKPELGPGQVRIAVRACGVNFPDLLMITGKYQMQPPMPFSPGAELAGDVVEVADGVTALLPGQKVVAVCGFGGMAEEICADADKVLPLPDAIDYLPAAAFLLTYGTAFHALKQRAGLRHGDSLVVLGAAGGVGLAAVEIGSMLGATVIAAASSDEKLQLARRYGAQQLIDYSRVGLKDAIKGLTGGRGADVVFDPVGGDRFEQCLRALAWGGRILVIGFASGRIPAVPANLALLKGASIVGVFWGRFAEEEPGRNAENSAELLRLLLEGKLRPHISEVFPLEQAGAAIRRVAERRAKGKVVVKI